MLNLNSVTGKIGNYLQGFVDDCALPASRRRVGNGSLQPRPSAEAVMNNRQPGRDGNVALSSH